MILHGLKNTGSSNEYFFAEKKCNFLPERYYSNGPVIYASKIPTSKLTFPKYASVSHSKFVFDANMFLFKLRNK